MKNLVILFSLLLGVEAYSQKDMVSYSIENNKKVVSQMNIDSLETVLIGMINSFRVSNGLSVLTKDESLSTYADEWSVNMLNKNKIYHSDIQSNSIVAENVYISKSFGVFPMTKEYVSEVTNRNYNSWLTSEKHKKNMLTEDINKIGVSIVLLPNGMVDESSTMVVN
jgi:uncharacterized protein YkwD